uniref:Glutathione synthetase n=1 Tax=Globodera pallida TaxID=36090 RepID=A0A183C2H9_GLOPA
MIKINGSSFIIVFLLTSFRGNAVSHNHVAIEGTKEAMQDYIENVVKNERELRELSQFAIEWSHNHALIVRTSGTQILDYKSDTAEFASVTLLPSPFPRKAFSQTLAVQTAMNLLYFRIASDYDFLMDAYKDVVKSDKHIRALVSIVKDVHEEGIKQPYTVMIQRADYMLNVRDNHDYEVKQVEVNCGSIVSLTLDRKITELHRAMLKKVGMDASDRFVPVNKAAEEFINVLYMAWKQYDDPNAIVVILTFIDFSPYKFDYTHIELELARVSDGQIKVEYLSLREGKKLSLDPETFTLRLNGRVVAVVNSGTSALGYIANEAEMETRRTIERSNAIKAPSLAIAISSSKKIQQLLANPGVLERFFPHPEDAQTVAAIRETFAGLWGLEHDDQKTQNRIKDAIENPRNYVLKPNRDCGGYNFFDEDVAIKLKEFTPDERAAHILMQRLHPMQYKNYFLRPFNEPELNVVTGELGVHGFLMGNMLDGTVLRNVQQGHLLRTKLAHVNEGGVIEGAGVGDSPYLF